LHEDGKLQLLGPFPLTAPKYYVEIYLGTFKLHDLLMNEEN